MKKGLNLTKKSKVIILSVIAVLVLIVIGVLVFTLIPKKAKTSLKYTLSDDGTYYIVTGFESLNENLVISETYQGKPVLEIADSCFSHQQTIKSVTIPQSVKKIGKLCFNDCKNLKSVTLSEGLTEIGLYAFNKTPITSLTLPTTLKKYNYSFAYCESLKTVTFPEGLTIIDDYAFYGATSIENVIIPKSVTMIGGSSFFGCESLISAQFLALDGWKVLNTSISSEDLKNPTFAAQLLTEYNYKYVWTRE